MKEFKGIDEAQPPVLPAAAKHKLFRRSLTLERNEREHFGGPFFLPSDRLSLALGRRALELRDEPRRRVLVRRDERMEVGLRRRPVARRRLSVRHLSKIGNIREDL